MQRPIDADAAQIGEANFDIAVIRLHLKPGDGGEIGEGGGTACQLGKARFRRRLLAGHELAFGALQSQRETERVMPLPAVLRQHCLAGAEVVQRHGKGRRRLGAPAGQQIKLGQLLPFFRRGDQGGAAIELAHNFEDVFFDGLRFRPRREQPADPQMGRRPFARGDQRVGRLLEPVVDEPIGARLRLDQFLPYGRPQGGVDPLLRNSKDDRKHRGVGDVSETGHLLQGSLRCGRQPGEFPEHEVHDVIGVSLGVNAIEVPGPARRIMVEGEHSFFGERKHELNGEERVATGLLEHQLRERRRPLRLAAKRVRKQLAEMLPAEWRERDLRDRSARRPDDVEHAHQRMRGIDLVVPIGADQHQVLQVRSRQQVLQQIERRRIEPLKIVEEQHQRMFGAGEYADEPLQHVLKAALRVLRRKLRNRPLFADDELEFGDQVDDQLSIRAQRFQKFALPPAQLRVALAEQRPNQALERLRERRIGDIALVLVEFARCEQPAQRHLHLVQLIDDRGFADAGISRDQHQFRHAGPDDAAEGGEQGLDLARPPVQFL